LILKDSGVKRLAVYVMHDDDGIVDKYIDVFLAGLRSETACLRVVINGNVEAEGEARIREIADEVIVRPNVGYDITAYKEGLLAHGYDDLCSYDEAVICNDTLYGPIHPFSEMFGAMAGRDLDFWGITAFFGAPFDPFGTISYGYLPKHIQSFFQVFRKDFMRTEDFRKWWEEMPAITKYEDAIGTHEAVFTKAMEDLGYTWDVYCDGDAISEYTWDPLRDFPRYCMETLRCPVMKKRTFYHDYVEAFERSGGEAAKEAFAYIKDETDYDERLITKNLIRTCNMADLRKRLGLTYVVPTKLDRTAGKKGMPHASQGPADGRRGESTEDLTHVGSFAGSLRTALILHIYYDDLAEECAAYASNMPEGIDMYVTVPDERKRVIVEPYFDEIKKSHRVEFRVSGNRGRDVAPFLVTCKDIFMKYDLVLKIHDKKVKQIPLRSIGRAWEILCFECLLPTETYVKNIIKLFEDHPDLGLLSPPIPVHGP
jgi:rhamnosyltransferase